MTLSKCQKCGMLFDSNLIRCPSCGIDTTDKKNKVIDLIGYTVSGLAIVAFILWLIFPPSNDPPSVKTAAEIRKEKIERQFSSWDGSHRPTEKIIKEAMHNPASYEHVRTRYEIQHDGNIIVRTTYRGTNAFNAIVINWATLEYDIDGNLIRVIDESD